MGLFQTAPKAQDHLGGKRKDLQDRVQRVNNPHSVTQPRALRATFRSVLGHLQGWGLYLLPGQLLPMNSPSHEEMDGSWEQGKGF